MITDTTRIDQVVFLTLVIVIFYVTSNVFFGNAGEYKFSVINYIIYHIVTPVLAKPTTTTTNTNLNQSQSTHTIIIKSGSGEKAGTVPIAFEPNQLFIKSGDKVVWINHDKTNHSVVSLSFNSGIIEPMGSKGNSYSFTFTRPGTFVYIDKFHPYMGGAIYVDVPASQRELISTTGGLSNVKVNVEMPQNAAYQNNYGPYFIPATVTIPQKAKVTWTNKDYVAHTATSGDGGVAFDTKTILPGESITLNVSLSKGVYPYYCKIHPWMLGNMVVS